MTITFKDVIPLIGRQTEPAQAVLAHLHNYFYAASLNGDRLATYQPVDEHSVRRHMHERVDFLFEPTGLAVSPVGFPDLKSSFMRTHWGPDQQMQAINAARGAMNEVINRRIQNGLSLTDGQNFREEASAEATIAAAHALGMN